MGSRPSALCRRDGAFSRERLSLASVGSRERGSLSTLAKSLGSLRPADGGQICEILGLGISDFSGAIAVCTVCTHGCFGSCAVSEVCRKGLV